ncbi:MAG: phage integrase N-terminal SAM-like domain-containing protein [Dokdonella sp.]|nr:phage integrase N-terminal SAM-like domain-containing protein [Dokdonella sp.]
MFDEIRRILRLKHYSLHTERAYTGWIRRFILAGGRRHPREMGAAEVEAFLSGMRHDLSWRTWRSAGWCGKPVRTGCLPVRR